MTEAQKILEMIEAVDPNDTATMDEIDARVWCYRRGYKFLELKDHKRSEGYYNGAILPTVFYKGVWHKKPTDFSEEPLTIIGRPTRRRDALKSIRPEGYKVQISIYEWGSYFKDYPGYKNESDCVLTPNYSTDSDCPYNNLSPIRSPRLPTEELAELHVIIQAIEYERTAK